MKIIKLQGGLGNQMFQYAYGRNIELLGKVISFDISFYHGNKSRIDTTREFKLDKFNIETKADFLVMRRPIYDLLSKILKKLKLVENGFWQNEKYFKNIEEIIRKEFTLKNDLNSHSSEISNKILLSTDSVSLHIRRGDYVNDKKTNQHHGTCDINYYKLALEYISSKIGKDIQIFVFSDDITWVKGNMSFPYPTIYVSSPEIPDYEELILMSKCKHNIIANSSFSWWAAWLNSNPDKIVIAPKKWANGAYNQVKFRDIIPNTWHKI